MANVELQQIGAYSITRLLSTSSTRSIYLGKQPKRKKEFLIQLLHAPLSTPEAREAFVTRARFLRKVTNRNMVAVLDANLLQDTEGYDCGYLVMEYISGETLRQHIPSGSCLPADKVNRIIKSIADALQHAHTLGIVHGNLHPGNIIKSASDEFFLTNFSLPLPMSDPDEEASTLPYTAPEVLQGSQPSAASDQYALAAMAYEWLCGRPPYEAADRATLLRQQEQAAITAPRSLNEAISEGVERILLQALARNPEERFQSVYNFSNTYLRTLMGLPVEINTETKVFTSRASTPVSAVLKDRAKEQDKTIEVEKDSKQSLLDRQIEQNKGKMQPKTRISFNPKDNQKSTNTEEISMTVSKPTPSQDVTNDTVSKRLATNYLLKQRYRILELRGQGTYGAVYKAADTQLGDRPVAIKEMLQENLNPQEIIAATNAFKEEAILLASLEHDSIPKIHEHFSEDNRWYIVMSFIEGETLEQYLKETNRGYLPLEKVLEIGIQLCDVLDYLHTHQPPIIFRDLKPSNIMRRAKDSRIYLIDFGIARHFKPGQAKDTTPVGTKGYAAPEQHGHGQTDAKSDIYSLGATLHQLISGINPWENPFSFVSLQSFDPLIPSRLSSLIAWMVEPDADKRPANMAVVKQELENIANELSTGHTILSSKKLVLRPTHDNTIHDEITEAVPIIQGEGNSEAKTFLKKKPVLGLSSFSLHKKVVADLEQGGGLSKSLPGYEERLAQLEMAIVVARSLTEDTPAIIEAATGTGKALDVDTPIPTPTGWKRMGDLVVGDFVFDEKGQPTRVTVAFDVMYDHKCYEVVFSDGSSIVADAEHEWVSYTAADRKWVKQQRTDVYKAKNFVTPEKLALLDRLIALSQNEDLVSVDTAIALIGGHQWSVRQSALKIGAINQGQQPARYPQKLLLTTVRDRLTKDLKEQRRDGRPYTLVTTEEMAATLTVSATQRANHAIPAAAPLCLPDADLPIAPYFLGVWLGDGSSRNNQITTADPDLISEIEKDGYTVRSLESHPFLYAVDDENGKAVSRWQPGMTGRLRALGLWRNKHIPAIYLRASEQQRRALLAGLLDTDGTVNHCGAAEFTTTSQQLAGDVYELVCSLGFRPTLRSGQAKFQGKDCGPKWTIAFTTDQQVYRLERKVNAHKERLRNYNPERNRFRYVIAVNEIPSRPVRCIQVDSPSHLYLASRAMIPTHNSLAYLIPIIRTDKKAIISTANKALQEQLFYKDIPFVQQHIQPFEAALVKGMGNYVCLDRLEEEKHGMQFYAKNADFMRLLNLTEDPDANFNGDFETLGFPLPGDIRSKVFADGDQCAWSKCGYFADCYVRKMRTKAEQAQVIVVNHTLLLLDAAMEGFLLPEHDIIIIDEAHHLEEEASRSFTVTINPAQINSLLAQRLLKEHSLQNLQYEVNKAMNETWERLRFMSELHFKGRANLTEPMEEGKHLASAISELAASLRRERPKDMPEKESTLYDKLLKRTQNLAENVRLVFSVDQTDKFVYYVERENTPGSRAGSQFQVSAAPLDVTEWLRERLFDKCNVICTSATLATIGASRSSSDGGSRTEGKGPNFSYFRRRVGLDHANYPEVLERILPLTFDYESNALLYTPRHLPEPAYGEGRAADEYTTAIAREMYRLVKCSRGRAFLLFSSRRMLDKAFDLMAPHLDYPLLRQGDMTRIELTRRFREEEGAILFGLKSFWEGVDIAGDALSLVVIDKLPFEPPDDPVHEARVAQMKAAGENWFGTYVLPQAVLRLKQGLGRLLRTREDRGVMAILDTRLHTKGYGKQVLNALPPARRTSSIRDVEQFFYSFRRNSEIN